MMLLILLFLDIFFKVLTNNILFFFLPFLLIYFLKTYKSFWILFLASSLINDLMLYIPLGFTGLIIGGFFLFLLFLKKFVSFESKNLVFLLNFLMQAIYIFSIFYFLKLQSFNLFFYIFLINFLFSSFIIFIYKVFF